MSDVQADSHGTITFSLTEDEFVAAYQCENRRRLIYPRGLWIAIGFACFYAVLCVLCTFAAGGDTVASFIGGVCFAAMLLFLFSAFITWRSCTATAATRAIYREQQEAGRDINVTWSPETLQITSELGTNIFSWPLFIRWAESPAVFLLYRSRALFIVIPKAPFTQKSLAAFHNFLTVNIKPAGRGRRKF